MGLNRYYGQAGWTAACGGIITLAAGLAAAGSLPSFATFLAILLSVVLGAATLWRYAACRDIMDPLVLFLASAAFYYGLHGIWVEQQIASGEWFPFAFPYVADIKNASLLVGLGIASLLIAYSFAPFNGTGRVRDQRVRDATPVAISVVFVGGFAARLYGLSIGVWQREAVITASNALVVTTLSVASLVAFIVATYVYYRNGTFRSGVVVMGIAHVAFAFATGRKELIVEAAFCWLAARHFAGRKLNAPTVLIVGAVFAFVITPIIQSGRGDAVTGLTGSQAATTTIDTLPSRAAEFFTHPERAADGWDIINRRTLGLEAVALTLASTPDRLPFQYGASYVDIPTSLIPRSVWPEKPEHNLTREFSIQYAGKPTDGSQGLTISPTIAGDFFLNFGVLGVAIGFALIGILLKWVTVSIKSGDALLWVALYSVLMLKLLLIELTVARLGSYLLLNGLVAAAAVASIRALSARGVASQPDVAGSSIGISAD